MKPANDLRGRDQRWLTLLRMTIRCQDCGKLSVQNLCRECRDIINNISLVPATRPLPGDPAVHL